LRQALLAWNERLETELTARGFVQSNTLPSLWIPNCEGGAVLTLIYINGSMVAGVEIA
jgi:hypothetical protein